MGAGDDAELPAERLMKATVVANETQRDHQPASIREKIFYRFGVAGNVRDFHRRLHFASDFNMWLCPI